MSDLTTPIAHDDATNESRHSRARRARTSRPAGWPLRRPLMPLRMQLGLLFGTVAALAVAIPMILHALVQLGDLERSVSEQNAELARVVGFLAEQRIDQTILALELVASSPGFADDVDVRDVNRLRTRLSQAVRLDSDLSSVLFVDRQGVVRAHSLSDGRVLSADGASAPDVQDALVTGRPAVGQAFRSVATGWALVRIVVPFRDRSGTVAGALQGMLSLERLAALVEGARGSGRGTVSLFDATGRQLTSPDPSLILSELAATNTVVPRALRGEPAAREMMELNGQLVYASAFPLAHGWVVEVHQPVDTARAALNAQLAQNGLFALAAFVVAMLVGIVAAQRVTEPLLTLLWAIRSIRDDQHGPALPQTSTAEVALLISEVEQMRVALDARATKAREELVMLSRYRLLAEQLSDTVLFLDEHRTIVEVNRAAELLYGYSRDELVGRAAFELLSRPEDRLDETEIRRAMLEGIRFETIHRRRDGSTLPVEVSLCGADVDGRVMAISIIRDVSVRSRSDEARARMLLHEREMRVREERAAEVTGIIQHMPCGVLVFDTDGILVLANEQAMDMLTPRANAGPAVADGILHPSQLLDVQLLSPCRALVNRALGGKPVSGQELRLGPSGPEARTVVGSAAPLRSPEGVVHGAVAVLVDVTRERRLVHDLTISESTLRHSLESLLVLHEASRDLSSSLVEEEIGRRLVESCGRIGRLDAAMVFQDNGRGDARLLGRDGDPLQIEHQLRCAVARKARQAALVSDGDQNVFSVPACSDASIAEGHFVVLRARGRTLGVLEIYGSEHRTPVTEDALASLAAHAASALDNARLYREVGDRELRLQDALRQLLIAQEEERRRVAYDLHDGLAQVAAATHLSLQTFASQYRTRSPERRKQLERSLELARRVVREARQAIAGLRPTTLDDFGLERALRLHVQELVSDGWSIEYHADLGPHRLPGPIETVLFRITQEALTNVRKHAQTLSATVSLRRDQGVVQLMVADKGVGFAAAPPSEYQPGQHLGLVGMRERAGLVGGRCTVESSPGKGTRVVARIPLGVVAVPAPGGAAPVAERGDGAGHVA